MVKIISQNVRGLQQQLKQRSVFNHLRSKADIICLQETHCDDNSESLWCNEWKGKTFWSNKSSNARGVAILVKDDAPIQVYDNFSDDEGRLIGICYKENEINFCLINVYGPNEDNPEFFVKMFKRFETYEAQRLIVGDFNVILNPKIDRNVTDEYKSKKATEIITQYIEDTMLTDIWRDRNPEARTYTWYRKKPNLSASRLDYMLIELSMASWIEKCTILPSYKSDHSAVYIEINPFQVKRGRGLWRMNARILKEIEYTELINKKIEELRNVSKHLTPHERWEMMKLNFIAETQAYCYERASNRRFVIEQLELKLIEYQNNITELTEVEENIMQRTKDDLNRIIEEKTLGCIFRSGANWYSEGERSTKYFFNLEKSRSGSKNMSCLIKDNGDRIYDANKIAEEQWKFYQKLYKKDERVKFNYVNESEIKLSEEENKDTAGLISLQELQNAVRDLKRNKAPGCDGLVSEFYMIFFSKFKVELLNAINYSFEIGRLHNTALKGIISLIPKRNLDTRKLIHMRPISLLNTDYKLLEKVLANRLKPKLEKLINYDQTGFMASRRINCNIRRILDIIDYAEEEDIPGAIISIDFLKCFDRIDTDALLSALKYFNFHKDFVRWTSIIYNGATSCVINNGQFSKPIKIKRSVKQGGPCSAFYFLILAEVLAIEIRKNPGVQGFVINEIHKVLGQFADDMDLYLLGTEKVVHTAFTVIEKFEMQSGFKINYGKTTVYRVGSLKKSKAQYYTKGGIKWVDKPINVLGVNISVNKSELQKINYEEILSKAYAILKKWSQRHLSLIGKVLIVNSLIGSLFVYKMTVLPIIDTKYINKLNQVISQFIWNKGQPKIALKTLQCNKSDGGLGLVSLKTRDLALKASWVKTIETDAFLQEFAYRSLCPKLRKTIWYCNIKPDDVLKCFKESFWRDVLYAWACINFDYHGQEFVNSQYLWYNSNIKIGGKPFIFVNAAKEGLMQVEQMFTPNGEVIPSNILCPWFNLTTMQYNGLITAIPKNWKTMLKKRETKTNDIFLYDKFITNKKCVAFYYNMINMNYTSMFKCYEKWKEKHNLELEFNEFQECYLNLYKTTNHPKLRSFQYRLLNNAVILNTRLAIWGIKNSDKCTNCSIEKETVKHFFWECETAKYIWEKVEKILKSINRYQIYNLNFKNILHNRITEDPENICNFICMVAKYYMYAKRYLKEKCTENELENLIFKYQRYELYFAERNNKTDKHYKKWQCKQNDGKYFILSNNNVNIN